jgi:hypothetical protein
MTTLADRSRHAHEAASEAARGRDRDWNRAYRDAIYEQGFELVPVGQRTFLGEDGPLWAPTPAADNNYYYEWPCVIAPKGWAT